MRLSWAARPVFARRFGPSLATLAAVLVFSIGIAQADNSTNSPAATGATAQPVPKVVKKNAKSDKKISGVELYAIHCNRCHPERYPVELNQTQWKTIMLHMRVRANLPADQARAILKYLQEEAGD